MQKAQMQGPCLCMVHDLNPVLFFAITPEQCHVYEQNDP
jgi:hypothetical protein